MKPFDKMNSFVSLYRAAPSSVNFFPSLEFRQRLSSIINTQREAPFTQNTEQQSSYYEDYCKLYFESIFYVNQVISFNLL